MKTVYHMAWMLSILFLFHTGALAAGEKIAVIDMETFRKKSVSFQKTSAAMKKKFDTMQAKLDEEQKAMKKLEEEFEKQKLMLSLDAQENKQLELEKKKRYVKYLYEDFTMEMKALEAEAAQKVMKTLEKIVKDVGAKEGYSLILERRSPGLMYFDESINITDSIIKLYDSQNP